MKRCSRCSEERPITQFYVRAGNTTHPWCKPCCTTYAKQQHLADPEAHAKRSRAWEKSNPDKMRARRARRYEEHPAARRPVKKGTHPKQYRVAWANRFFMDEAYRLAKLRSKATGIVWEVDHIVPLKSDVVCGFHCESNLQVITRLENVRKGNKLVAGLVDEVSRA